MEYVVVGCGSRGKVPIRMCGQAVTLGRVGPLLSNCGVSISWSVELTVFTEVMLEERFSWKNLTRCATSGRETNPLISGWQIVRKGCLS